MHHFQNGKSFEKTLKHPEIDPERKKIKVRRHSNGFVQNVIKIILGINATLVLLVSLVIVHIEN